jgi:tetratricopeptide (TPR) repeat protein
MDREYAVAEKKNDLASMAADLQAKGNILAEAKKYEDAQKAFNRSLQLVGSSSLSQEIKDNAKLLHHFNQAALAIDKHDFAAAQSHSTEFQQGAELSRNPVQLKQAHELAGRLSLARRDYDKAIVELEQANLQNPQNLYRLAECYQAKGEASKAKDYAAKAANFNSLPALPYAFVRTKARQWADKRG